MRWRCLSFCSLRTTLSTTKTSTTRMCARSVSRRFGFADTPVLIGLLLFISVSFGLLCDVDGLEQSEHSSERHCQFHLPKVRVPGRCICRGAGIRTGAEDCAYETERGECVVSFLSLAGGYGSEQPSVVCGALRGDFRVGEEDCVMVVSFLFCLLSDEQHSICMKSVAFSNRSKSNLLWRR